MNELFQQIKDRLPILPTITRLSNLQKKGPHLEACPLCGHRDCFSVMEARAAWKCHSCGEGGDIFTFLEKYERLDAAGALRRAAELAGVTIPERPTNGKKTRALSARERIYLAAADYYHDHLFEQGGRAYFVEARKHTEATLRKMRAGMSTGGLYHHLKEQGFSDRDLFDSGLIVDKDGVARDYWGAGLAIFPVFNSDGGVITLTMKDPAKRMQHAVPRETVKEWFLNHPALAKWEELIVVEGQNDGATLHDAGIDHWIGTAGAVSKEQIQLLRNFRAKKHTYLWFDKDKGGAGHARRIYQALQEQEYRVKVIVHPGEAKDPDAYLQQVRSDGKDPRAAYRALRDAALDPLKWEIHLIKQLPTLEEKLKELEGRGIFKAVNQLSDIDQEVYVEALTDLGFSEKAIRQKLETEVTLLSEAQAYLAEMGRNVKGLELAEICYKWFAGRGRFFRTGEGKVWLLYRHTIYEISDNLPFRTLMGKLTRLNLKESPGKQLYECLQTLCYDRGELIDVVSWIHTNRETDTVYINLNSPKSEIVKISPGADPEMIPNGTNKEGVLLSSSGEIKPFEYLPSATEAEGMAALRDYLFENLSCEREMRYFILAWVLSILLVDFNKNRALLHCTGASASGKSTAVSLISQLVYGQDLVGQSSAASSFSEGSHAPLVIQDNIENRDLTKQMVNFLLLAANSATKKKRKGGTDSDVVTEKISAMVVLTSIEPIPGSVPELVNRTFQIIFEHRWHGKGFVEDEASRGLTKKRNVVLSAIMRMIAHKVLPRLESRAEWLTYINTEFPKHNKARTNEYISTLLVVLEAVLGFIPYYPAGSAGGDEPVYSQARDLLKAWIRYEDELADETAVTSNTILNLLDGLAREVYAVMKQKVEQMAPHPDYDDPVFAFQHEEYLLEFVKTTERAKTADELLEDDPEEPSTLRHFEFVSTSAALQMALNKYCKNNGIKNPFSSPSELASRISNDRKLLEKGGWRLVTSEGKDPYFRIRRGERFWKFSKRLDQVGR